MKKPLIVALQEVAQGPLFYNWNDWLLKYARPPNFTSKTILFQPTGPSGYLHDGDDAIHVDGRVRVPNVCRLKVTVVYGNPTTLPYQRKDAK